MSVVIRGLPIGAGDRAADYGAGRECGCGEPPAIVSPIPLATETRTFTAVIEHCVPTALEASVARGDPVALHTPELRTVLDIHNIRAKPTGFGHGHRCSIERQG